MGYHVDDIRGQQAKLWLKLASIVACLGFVCAEVWAAAALAIDNNSGDSGHGIASTKAAAILAAKADATNNGAANPVFWFWHKGPGWGAVYFSDDGAGAWTIGGSLAYKKKRKAKQRAKQECIDQGGTNCQKREIFHDTFTSKDGNTHGVGFHMSSPKS